MFPRVILSPGHSTNNTQSRVSSSSPGLLQEWQQLPSTVLTASEGAYQPEETPAQLEYVIPAPPSQPPPRRRGNVGLDPNTQVGEVLIAQGRSTRRAPAPASLAIAALQQELEWQQLSNQITVKRANHHQQHHQKEVQKRKASQSQTSHTKAKVAAADEAAKSAQQGKSSLKAQVSSLADSLALEQIKVVAAEEALLEAQLELDQIRTSATKDSATMLKDTESEHAAAMAQLEKMYEAEKKEVEKKYKKEMADHKRSCDDHVTQTQEHCDFMVERCHTMLLKKDAEVELRMRQLDKELAMNITQKERLNQQEQKQAREQQDKDVRKAGNKSQRLEAELKQLQEDIGSQQAKLKQLQSANRNILKDYVKEGRALPSWKDINTSDPKVHQALLRDRAVSLLPFLKHIGKHVTEFNTALEMCSPSYGFKKFKPEVETKLEVMRSEGLVLKLHELDVMKKLTVGKVKNVIEQINNQMDPDCEADVKIITGTSDELLEYGRDRRFKVLHPDGSTSNKQVLVYPDQLVDSVISCSKRQRVKKMKERAEAFNIKTNENGTIAYVPMVEACERCTRYARGRDNSLVPPGGKEYYVFSGDALQTGKGENSTICAVRSAELKYGWSSSYNFQPVSNCLGKDDHATQAVVFAPQRDTVNKAIFAQQFGKHKAQMGLTGDLAFLNSFYGMGPPSATFGNPWVGLPTGLNGQREDVNSNGDPNWKSLDDMYLLSHTKPVTHDFQQDGKIKCPAKGCKFTAKCQEDIDKDKEKLLQMTKSQKAAWAKQHLNNYPHQAPLFHIDPQDCFPGMYHFAENLMDHRWKHLIWDACGEDNKKKYKVNQIMSTEIGYAHLPQKAGEEVYCMSFIGQDVNNFRASTTLHRVLNVLYPEEMSKLQGTASPHHTASAPHHSQFNEVSRSPQRNPSSSQVNGISEEMMRELEDEAYEDAVPSPTRASAPHHSVEEQVNQAAETAEHAAMADLSKPELISLAFDYAFILIDAVQEDQFDDSPQGRLRQANKIKTLAMDCHAATQRAYAKPYYSEYDTVGKVVFPAAIVKHGRRVQRCNEQGQEQLGQRFKRSMKFRTSKWRTFGSHLRRIKKGETKLVTILSTATLQSFRSELLVTDVAQKSNHRIHVKQRSGAAQASMKQKGVEMKRDHQPINPILKDDKYNTEKIHKYVSEGRMAAPKPTNEGD